MILLAIDPGLTTGVAWWNPDDSRPQADQLVVKDFYEWAERTILHNVYETLVACEAFVISARTLKGSPQPAPIELIGVTKYLCERGGHELVMQQASAAKRFCPNDRLRQVGWYVPGRDHANDALRHLYLLAITRKIIAP